MLIKAILTTLLLGASSVAMAQPYPPHDYHPNQTYSPDTGEWRADSRRGRFWRRQFVLANDLTLVADRQASFIRIDPRARVGRLRLELESGRAFIDSVFVTYADGRQQTVVVRRMISPGMPRLVIDLPERGITGVAINSTQMRSARGGGYRYMRAATVDVIGVRR
ncbi:MAG TPA: hypothetical protein VIV11_35205 [Kofleriaceae bacterium]